MKIRGRAAARRAERSAELARVVAEAVADHLRPYGPRPVVNPNRFALPPQSAELDYEARKWIREAAEPILREISAQHLMHAHDIIGQAERIASLEVLRHMVALREALGLARLSSEPLPDPLREDLEDDAPRPD